MGLGLILCYHILESRHFVCVSLLWSSRIDNRFRSDVMPFGLPALWFWGGHLLREFVG